MADHTVYIVQPYVAKPHRLVPQPAQAFEDEGSARRAAGRLARFRAGVLVLSQAIDPFTAQKGVPATLAIYGQVPEGWTDRRAA